MRALLALAVMREGALDDVFFVVRVFPGVHLLLTLAALIAPAVIRFLERHLKREDSIHHQLAGVKGRFFNGLASRPAWSNHGHINGLGNSSLMLRSIRPRRRSRPTT